MNVSRSILGVAAVNGTIYAIGGYGDKGVLGANEAYNPVNDTWTNKTAMPTPRYSFGITVYEGKIYCIGGILSNGDATAVTEVYDTTTDTWQTKTPMPTARSQIDANVLNNKIYVVAGRTGGPNTTVNTTEVYDPNSNSWSKAAAIPYPVVAYVSAVVNNTLYVFGGQDEYSSSMNLNTTQIYNVTSNSWHEGAPMPASTVQATAAATTGLNAPQAIYIFGGSTGFGIGSNVTYMYNPQTNNWTSVAQMPTARYAASVAVVNDQFYVIGGGANLNTFTINEQYTPFGYQVAPEFPVTIVFSGFLAGTVLIAVALKKKTPATVT